MAKVIDRSIELWCLKKTLIKDGVNMGGNNRNKHAHNYEMPINEWQNNHRLLSGRTLFCGI